MYIVLEEGEQCLISFFFIFRLAISLGGDSDTLAAIAGPMAYVYYKEMPDPLVYQALKSLPDWMQRTNAAFDQRCEEIGALG